MIFIFLSESAVTAFLSRQIQLKSRRVLTRSSVSRVTTHHSSSIKEALLKLRSLKTSRRANLIWATPTYLEWLLSNFGASLRTQLIHWLRNESHQMLNASIGQSSQRLRDLFSISYVSRQMNKQLFSLGSCQKPSAQG